MYQTVDKNIFQLTKELFYHKKAPAYLRRPGLSYKLSQIAIDSELPWDKSDTYS
jgi:hypothetical protein